MSLKRVLLSFKTKINYCTTKKLKKECVDNKMLNDQTTVGAADANNTLPVVDKNEVLNRNTHRVNKLERKFLVWTGSRYKTEEEIPNYITPAAMEKARNKMRIAVANLMMLGSVIGALLMIMLGKMARNRGESLQQQSIDWHLQLKESAKRNK